MAYRLVIGDKGIQPVRTGGNGGEDFLVLCVFLRYFLKQRKGRFVIVALRQFRGLLKDRGERLLSFFGGQFLFRGNRFLLYLNIFERMFKTDIILAEIRRKMITNVLQDAEYFLKSQDGQGT